MPKPLFPWIKFVDSGADGSSTANPDEYLPGDADLNDDDFKAKRGFPRGVKKDDMEPEERERYWRYESKKQQHQADSLRRENDEWAKLGKRDDIKATLDQQEQHRRENLNDGQKAVEDARTEGRTAGETAARDKYLAPAVEGQVVAITRGTGETVEDATERVRGALAFVDVAKFLNDNGELDADKIQTFAQSIAPKDGNGNDQVGDPLYQSLGREALPQKGAAGSVAASRQAAYERNSTKK